MLWVSGCLVAATGLLDRRVESIARAVAEALDSPVFQAFPTIDKVRRMLEKRALHTWIATPGDASGPRKP